MSFFGQRFQQRLAAATAQGEVLTQWGWDDMESQNVLHRCQDVEPILEHNKALVQDGDGYSPDRTFRRVASIPNVIVEQWMREGINIFRKEDWPKVQRRLNDREWSHLRTAPGRL